LVGKVAEWHLTRTREEEGRKVMEKIRKQNHFSATESTCAHTLEALFPSLRKAIEERLDSDKILAVLRDKPPPEEKLLFWQELKVISISRCLVLVVGGVYMSVILRVQLNILAGNLFERELSRGVFIPPTPNQGMNQISIKVQEKFLNICSHFVADGIVKLCETVAEVVKAATDSVDLKQKLSLVDVEAVFNRIFDQCHQLEGDSNIFHNPAPFFLPNDEHFLDEFSSDEQILLKQMFADLLDVVDSDDTKALVKQLCKQGLSHLVDRIAEYYAAIGKNSREPSPSTDSFKGVSEDQSKNQLNDRFTGDDKRRSQDSGFVSPVNVSLHLAKLIPILTAQVRSADSEADLWLLHLQEHPGTKVLGANVYEAFCQTVRAAEQNTVDQHEGWGDFLMRSASSWF